MQIRMHKLLYSLNIDVITDNMRVSLAWRRCGQSLSCTATALAHYHPLHMSCPMIHATLKYPKQILVYNPTSLMDPEITVRTLNLTEERSRTQLSISTLVCLDSGSSADFVETEDEDAVLLVVWLTLTVTVTYWLKCLNSGRMFWKERTILEKCIIWLSGCFKREFTQLLFTWHLEHVALDLLNRMIILLNVF